MDASREPAGQRAGSRRTSSALWMEFSSNTGMCFRTRLRKRNPRGVDLCSETVSPSHAETNPSPIFTSRFAERCEAKPDHEARGQIAHSYSIGKRRKLPCESI